MARHRVPPDSHCVRTRLRAIPIVCCALLLAAQARAEVVELRVTGEHTAAQGDAPEVARTLAWLDAARKGLQQATARVGELPAVKALQLPAGRLPTYVAGLVEVPEPSQAAPDGKLVRAQVSIRIDLDDVARRIDWASRDAEITVDLRDTWKRIEQLQTRLASDAKAVAAATGEARSRAAAARQQTLTALRMNLFLALASGAMVHEEIGTSSIAIVPPEGLVRARQLADKALDLDRTSKDAIARQGDVLMAEGKPEDAEPAFREALRQDPQSALLHDKLGNVLFSLADFAGAVAEYRTAIMLNPGDAISHADLGDALRAQRNAQGAITEYRAAIALDPTYVNARHNLGITLASQQRVPEALVEFQEAIRLQPASARGHYNAAIALADLEQDEASAKAWREAVRLNPNNYNAHYNLGEMLRLIGELKESAAAFKEYVKRAPDTPATQKNKARARTFIEAFEEP
jgi:tetratricopeptide (TPR) repeat protein